MTFLSSSDKNTIWGWILLAVSVVLLIAYIIIISIYTKLENEEKIVTKSLEEQNQILTKSLEEQNQIFTQKNQALEKQVDAFKRASSIIIKTNKSTATTFNKIAYSINKNSSVPEKLLDFDMLMMLLCENIREFISEISYQGEDFAVIYVRRIKDDIYKNHIKTVGAAVSPSGKRPNNFRKTRDYTTDLHYDAKIFSENLINPFCTSDPEKIFELFHFHNKGKKRGLYSQYMVFPVLCEEEKIIGVLQVISMNGSKIAADDKELINLQNRFMSQFSYLALILFKSCKAIFALPEKS